MKEYFIEFLKSLTTKLDPEYPDYIFYLNNKNKIVIKYNKKLNNAWLDYEKIWSVFETKYHLKYQEIRKITGLMLEQHLKLKGVTTNKTGKITLLMLEQHLKLKGVTTIFTG
mgnify:CR=1 FL=1